jgi:hypothetical protein
MGAVLDTIGTDPTTLILLQEEGVPEHGTAVHLAPFETLMGGALVNTHVGIGSDFQNRGH